MAPFLTPTNTLARAAAAGLFIASVSGCDKPKPAPYVPAQSSPQAPASQPSETKPGDSKPGEPKPLDAKPADTKSASPSAQHAANPEGTLPIEKVTIAGKEFKLERADNNDSRVAGLSGRASIAPDGGMIFVFAESRRLNFVMRDCPIAIDIIFLDPSGRVVAQHRMKPEEPRRPGEDDQTYERRLRLYPSSYGAQFAIELKEGTLDQLKLKNGDQIKLDLDRLKHAAK